MRTLETLVKLLPEAERAKPQLLVLSGGVTPYRNDTDREILFRQESNFFYLTGCSVPGSHLVVAYQQGTSFEQNPQITLFIPEVEEADLMWSVPPPDLDAAKSLFDASDIQYASAFTKHLQSLLTTFTHTAPLIHTLPPAQVFPEPKLTTALLLALAPPVDDAQELAALTDAFLLPALHRTRLLKDAYEVGLIRKANEVSSRAHETVMRVLGAAVKGEIKGGDPTGRPLLPGEWLIQREEEAEAIFVASCRREGSEHQAYMPIVAGAGRASTLHYTCNCESLGPNKSKLRTNEKQGLIPQVLLIDAGCEWECYASDITRTMPVGNGGKFAPEARAIYELVWEMQNESFKILKAGLHWDEVQLLCHRVLVRRFQKLGIFKSPNSPNGTSANHEDAILASGISSAFFPHGVGHSLGMDVHDVPSASKPEVNGTIADPPKGCKELYTYLRLRLPLEAGMVVTVEPGCYFHPHLLAPVRDSKHINKEVLAKYEGMGGVRIEDVVLITADGYENLTTVRSEVDWVEGVCSGKL